MTAALVVHRTFAKVIETEGQGRTLARVCLKSDGSWDLYAHGAFLEGATARKAGAFIVGFAIGVSSDNVTADLLQPVCDAMEATSATLLKD